MAGVLVVGVASGVRVVTTVLFVRRHGVHACLRLAVKVFV